MASKRYRPLRSGEPRWAILFRHEGKQTCETFAVEERADRFMAMLDLVGYQAALDDIQRQAANTNPTVREYVNNYVNNLSGITEGTRSDYRSYAKRDLGAIGGLPVDLLTREAVAKWVNSFTGRLSGKSIKNRHSLLSAAMTRAQRDGVIPANPCKGIRLPRSIKRDMTFLTHNEFAQLLGAIPAYWQPFVTTLVGTGMRWGEATALTAGDVDLDADQPVIHIRQAWKHTDGKGRELGPPKTRKGKRTISLDAHVVDCLRPLVEGKAADALVFLNHQGRPVHGSTFLVHVWQPAIKASKLTKTPRVHDLRHTHASWLIAGNVPLTFIQVRLGHESIATTSDCYGHLAPEAGAISAAVTSLALAQAFPTIESDVSQDLPQIGDKRLGDSPTPEDEPSSVVADDQAGSFSDRS